MHHRAGPDSAFLARSRSLASTTAALTRTVAAASATGALAGSRGASTLLLALSRTTLPRGECPQAIEARVRRRTDILVRTLLELVTAARSAALDRTPERALRCSRSLLRPTSLLLLPPP